MADMSDFKAKPLVAPDTIGASREGASLYELIREDIIDTATAETATPRMRARPSFKLVIEILQILPARHAFRMRGSSP